MFTKRPIDYWLVWGVALISLALNVFVIKALLDARQQVAQAAQAAATGVAKLRTGAIDYNFHIDQQLPVKLTVTYNNTITVPISDVIPINTQFPVDIPVPIIGTYHVVVPISTVVPISLTQRIPINIAIPVSTTVPILMDVPIHINIAETSLGASLVDVENYLNQTSQQMGGN